MSDKLQQQVQAVGERIASTSCVLELHVRQPGFRKKMNSYEFLNRSGNNENISHDVLTVSKDVIEPRDLQYLHQHRQDFLRKIKQYSVYGGGLTLGNGQYLIPLTLVEQVKKDIDEFEAQRKLDLDKFEQDYEQLKQKAKSKLGGFYKETDYPKFESLRKRYTLDYRFLSNAVPEEFDKLSKSLRQAEERRLRKELHDIAEDSKAIMRTAFLYLLEHLTEKLGKDPDTGRHKSLPDTRVRDLMEFIALFDHKNIVGDKSLKAEVDKVKDILDGVTIRDLKFSGELRDAVNDKLKEVADSTTDLVKEHSRAIDISRI